MNFRKFGISGFAIVLVAIIVLSIDNNLGRWKAEQGIIVHDVYPFYAYLPATFIYHDLGLDFVDGGTHNGQFILWPKITPEGKKVITASMGMSVLYFPFFLPAHVYAVCSSYPPDGYSAPYKVALMLSSAFFLILGLIYLRKLLRKYFSDLVTAIVLFIIPIATNILWYTVVESAMSHVYNFALISIFLYHTDRWHEEITLKRSIIIGLLAGLIALIRPTNILVLILFFFWDVKSWNEAGKRVIFFLHKWRHVLLMIIAFVLVWIPQFLYWKMQTGQYLYYSYPDDQGFFFGNPQIWNSLFSWRKGWLLYTPVMIFAVAGIAAMRKNHPKLFLPVLIYTLVTIYVISSWWDWWYGGGFGLRAYIDMYGVFALPMAASLTWIINRKMVIKYALILIFLLLTARSLFHHVQYHYGAIHWFSMTREAYLDSFFRIRPSDRFPELIKNPDYTLARKGIYKYEGEE
ncbi:MAG: hypothetical protein IH598_02690 [Bacteroidales bacterium]|nr:hypothetical protein [Bacteroidales bacterium]